jgi:hypothetical protein
VAPGHPLTLLDDLKDYASSDTPSALGSTLTSLAENTSRGQTSPVLLSSFLLLFLYVDLGVLVSLVLYSPWMLQFILLYQ